MNRTRRALAAFARPHPHRMPPGVRVIRQRTYFTDRIRHVPACRKPSSRLAPSLPRCARFWSSSSGPLRRAEHGDEAATRETVVFPDAAYKFFFHTDREERARRRLKDLPHFKDLNGHAEQILASSGPRPSRCSASTVHGPARMASLDRHHILIPRTR